MRYCLVWHQAIKNKPKSPIVALSSLTEMCVSPRMHACWFCWMIWQFSVNAHRIAAHSGKLLSVRMVGVCTSLCAWRDTEPSACVSEGASVCISGSALPETILLFLRLSAPPPRDKLCSLWHHHPSGPAATRYSHPLLPLPLSYSSLTPVCRSLLSPPAAHRARPARASAAPRTSPCPRPCSLPLPPSPPEITSPPLKARRLSGAAAPLPSPPRCCAALPRSPPARAGSSSARRERAVARRHRRRAWGRREAEGALRGEERRRRGSPRAPWPRRAGCGRRAPWPARSRTRTAVRRRASAGPWGATRTRCGAPCGRCGRTCSCSSRAWAGRWRRCCASPARWHTASPSCSRRTGACGRSWSACPGRWRPSAGRRGCRRSGRTRRRGPPRPRGPALRGRAWPAAGSPAMPS